MPEVNTDYVKQAAFAGATKIKDVGKLTRIATPKLFFDFGKGEKSFPFNQDGGNNFQTTILCESKDEQDRFIM